MVLTMHRSCFPEKGWEILKKINKILLNHKAVLAGGTALALQLGHRKSLDLDFFTLENFKVDRILKEINLTGMTYQMLSEGKDFFTINLEGIKTSLFKYEYPFIEKPVIYENITIANLVDIAAMKIIAICQKGVKRDFIDLYFILQKIPFHLIVNCMVKKYGLERINPIIIGKSLIYFPDADTNPDPEYLKGFEMEWKEVRNFFQQHVKQYVLDLNSVCNKSSE